MSILIIANYKDLCILRGGIVVSKALIFAKIAKKLCG